MEDVHLKIAAHIGWVVISGALALPLLVAHESIADEPDPLEDMVVIEASLAMKKSTKKITQPQKDFKTPDQTKKPDGVSHDENKKPDDKKDDKKKPDEKEPDLDISKYKHGDPDQPTGPVNEPFNPNESVTLGNDAITKGSVYFGTLKTMMDNSFRMPTISGDSPTAPLGCIHLTPEGKIAETKFKQESEGDIQIAAEVALKDLVKAVNADPKPVTDPDDLKVISKFICFKFNIAK